MLKLRRRNTTQAAIQHELTRTCHQHWQKCFLDKAQAMLLAESITNDITPSIWLLSAYNQRFSHTVNLSLCDNYASTPQSCAIFTRTELSTYDARTYSGSATVEQLHAIAYTRPVEAAAYI